MLKTRIACLIAGLVAASCAIPEPPPGGPEDKTPPEVLATRPEAGASGIPADAAIEFVFSEKMSTTRFDRLVELSPAAKIARARWKKNAVTIEFEGPLHPDTTYLVRVKPGYADAHNVRNDRPFEFAFATSAEIDTGSISGRVYFRRKPSEKGVVRLFALPKDSVFAPEAARPDRETTTQKDGAYEFRHLPARGGSFVVWAFHDTNGNGVMDRDGEVGAALPDTVALSEGRPRLELQDVVIVDPKEPASVAGVVVNATPYDSVRVSLALHEAADTLPPTYFVRADDGGRYAFKSVLKGVYALHAFIDLRPDSVCGAFPCPGDSSRACPEFCATYPESLVISPGDEVRLKDLRLEETGKGKE